MLSALPGLLFLAPVSAFLIRAAIGIALIYAARRHFADTEQPRRALAAAEFVLALALLVGAWTQVAAIAAGIIVAAWLFAPRLSPLPRAASLLALVMCLSLIVTGAGAFAVDLPL